MDDLKLTFTKNGFKYIYVFGTVVKQNDNYIKLPQKESEIVEFKQSIVDFLKRGIR